MHVLGGTASISGQTLVFTPAAGFSGTATVELLADDGYSVSSPLSLPIAVSAASLIGIALQSPTYLYVGGMGTISAVGDFADEAGVALPGSFVTLTSSQPSVVLAQADGSLSALERGFSIVTLSAQGLSRATVVHVVDAAPTDPTGVLDLATFVPPVPVIDAFPETVTLVEGVGTRQIVVHGSDGSEASSAVTGTLYFVSNPTVAEVTADGLISTNQAGRTDVTVVTADGGVADVHILVAPAEPNGSTIDSAGGAVVMADGSFVAIGPGALAGAAAVHLERTAEADSAAADADSVRVSRELHPRRGRHGAERAGPAGLQDRRRRSGGNAGADLQADHDPGHRPRQP